MTTYLLQALGLIAAGLIGWRAETALNLMGPACRLAVRAAFWALLVGAAGMVYSILQGYAPSPSLALLLSGAALLLVKERRIKSLIHLHSRGIRERRHP